MNETRSVPAPAIPTSWMMPDRSTVTDRDGPVGRPLPGSTGVTVACQPVDQAMLRSRRTGPVAWTVTCWEPSRPGATVDTAVPAGGAPPPVPSAQAQPRAAVLRKAPNPPMVPV